VVAGALRGRSSATWPGSAGRYLARISGPLLDRIDIHLEMSSVSFREMTHARPAEDSRTLRVRVADAWERQQERLRDHPRVVCNAQMGLAEIRTFCNLQRRPLGLLRMAVSRLGLSPRAFHRVLRLSRTIADLAGSGEIGEVHVAEAISYRLLDRGVGSPVS
jgi:magnesium chelatase family protein